MPLWQLIEKMNFEYVHSSVSTFLSLPPKENRAGKSATPKLIMENTVLVITSL